ILAVERIVAKKSVHSAAQGVGAAPCDDIDIAAECPTQLRLTAAGDDLKLLYGIDAKGDPAEPGRIVVGGHAVDDEAVGEVALTRDRQPLPWDRRGFCKQLRAVRVGR